MNHALLNTVLLVLNFLMFVVCVFMAMTGEVLVLTLMWTFIAVVTAYNMHRIVKEL